MRRNKSIIAMIRFKEREKGEYYISYVGLKHSRYKQEVVAEA